jgi:hypothetical protein
MEDFTGIDIADAYYAALIHEERFYGESTLLSYVPKVGWVEIIEGVFPHRETILLFVYCYGREASGVDEKEIPLRKGDLQTGMR